MADSECDDQNEYMAIGITGILLFLAVLIVGVIGIVKVLHRCPTFKHLKTTPHGPNPWPNRDPKLSSGIVD
jgi:hypothetical protein